MALETEDFGNLVGPTGCLARSLNMLGVPHLPVPVQRIKRMPSILILQSRHGRSIREGKACHGETSSFFLMDNATATVLSEWIKSGWPSIKEVEHCCLLGDEIDNHQLRCTKVPRTTTWHLSQGSSKTISSGKLAMPSGTGSRRQWFLTSMGLTQIWDMHIHKYVTMQQTDVQEWCYHELGKSFTHLASFEAIKNLGHADSRKGYPRLVYSFVFACAQSSCRQQYNPEWMTSCVPQCPKTIKKSLQLSKQINNKSSCMSQTHDLLFLCICLEKVSEIGR